MKRFSIFLVLLLVVAVCGFSAWFVLRDVDVGAPVRDGPESAAVDGVDDATPDGGGDAVDEGGRKRVHAPGTTGADGVPADAVIGTVLYEGEGVAGATIEAFGAPGGEYDPRRAQARRIFGDMFDEEDLERLERRFRDLRPQGDVSTSDDGDASDGSGGSVRIGIGFGSGGDEEVDPEAASEALQEAQSAGLEMVGRLLSDPTLMEKLLELGKLETAGFQTDEDWPRVGATRSEADGSFVLTGLPVGKVELRVRAAGYVRAKRIVEVGKGGVELKLSRGTVLEGVVTSGGEPVAGASVRTRTRTVETDGTGRFRVDGAVTPKESVLVTARGFVATGRSVPLSVDGPNDPVTIEIEPAAIVRGVVVASDGTPLAGASVRVTKGESAFNPMMFMQLAQPDNVGAPSPATVADANGVFEIDGIPGGTVKLAAEQRGYLTFITESLAVTAGEVSDGIELRLLRESAVTGRVVGPDGAPVVDATVKVELEAEGMGAMLSGLIGGMWQTGRTDEDGRYRVGRLTQGERTVRVESSQFLYEEATVQVPAEADVEWDFTLRPGHTLEGLVVTPSGDPAAGARVELRWAADAGASPLAAMTGMTRGADATTTADAEGRFRMEGLQDGPYTVTAKSDEHLDAEVGDVAPDSTDVVLQLRAAAVIRGVVVDEDGQPVGGAWVHRKGGPRSSGNPFMAMFAGDPRVLTGADGSFEMPKLEPGRYQLYTRRKGYAESEKLKVQVSDGESVTGLELVLRPGESLAGRVVDKQTGEPVEGALVYVPVGSGPMAGLNPSEMVGAEATAPPGSIDTTTDADGGFVLDGLTPGRVTVEVRSAEHAPATLSRIDVPGPEVTVEISSGGRVEGYVVDASGNAVAGTSVLLSGGAMGFGRRRTVETDAAGFYAIDRVAPGSYQIMKMDSSSAFGVGGMSSVVVKDGETTRHDFRPDTTGARISGSVLRDGEPVEGAMVILTGGSTGMQMKSSDGKGAFTFDGLEAGSYTISVQAELLGSGTKSETVKVTEGQRVDGVTLQLSSLSLKGRIVDAESGEGVPLAQVILFDGGAGASRTSSLEEVMRNQRGQTMTDDKGRFTITGVEEGTFSLRVSAQGYADEVREGVKPGANLTIRLQPGADFEVTVLGPDGAPVMGATVVARDAAGNETMTIGMGGLRTVTNAQGLATLQLAPGRHTIVAETAEMPAASAEVDSSAGSVVIRLEAGAALEVVVRKGGKPVSGARVALQDGNGLPIIKRVSAGNILGGGAEATDAAGRVVREGLPVGTVTVLVTPPEGGDPVRRTVTVARGATEKLEIDLP